MVRFIELLSYIIFMFVVFLSCKNNSNNVESHNKFIIKLIEDLDACTELNSFKYEKVDSLPFKLKNYEVLIYDCLYPLLRTNYDNEISELKKIDYLKESDLGYFILMMIHNKLNHVEYDEYKLLVFAKEMKYQEYLEYINNKQFQDYDYYYEKAWSVNRIDINDTLTFSLLVFKNIESDTMIESGIQWQYENQIVPEEYIKTYLQGVVMDKFIDHQEGVSIYYKIRLIEMKTKYLKYYDSIYTKGSVFPLNLLKHGGELNVK
jgi:hypothetical protein